MALSSSEDEPPNNSTSSRKRKRLRLSPPQKLAHSRRKGGQRPLEVPGESGGEGQEDDEEDGGEDDEEPWQDEEGEGEELLWQDEGEEEDEEIGEMEPRPFEVTSWKKAVKVSGQDCVCVHVCIGGQREAALQVCIWQGGGKQALVHAVNHHKQSPQLDTPSASRCEWLTALASCTSAFQQRCDQ